MLGGFMIWRAGADLAEVRLLAVLLGLIGLAYIALRIVPASRPYVTMDESGLVVGGWRGVPTPVSWDEVSAWSHDPPSAIALRLGSGRVVRIWDRKMRHGDFMKLTSLLEARMPRPTGPIPPYDPFSDAAD